MRVENNDKATTRRLRGGVTGKGFQPGRSENPGGRPKNAPLSQACRELLALPVPNDAKGRTYAEAIAEVLAKKALGGDIRAAQELADRAEGRAHQSIEFQNAELREAFERMSGEELKAYASTGKLPAWFPRHEEVNTEPI
jgi:uncharacterized protein DUF5681